MTTPNIEELIAAFTQTNQLHEDADICTADIINVLQSQAERIKELESECLNSDIRLATVIEQREKLRAQLMEIGKTEPVLVVEKEPDYWSGGHFHEGSKPHIKSTKVWCLPIGTQLFTRPMPANRLTE